MWRHYGINYVSYNWNDNDTQVIIPATGAPETVLKLIRHVKNVISQGNSILVHSKHGMNRSVVLIACFLMSRYSWSPEKSMEFILIKKPTVRLRQSFFDQLKDFERYLKSKGKDITTHWREGPKM
jgi:protein-tyrosine phosphatase